MINVSYATIKELRALLDSKKISSQELVSLYADRIKKHDVNVKALIELFDEQSVVQESAQNGPLAGIPGVVKNNICIKNRVTSCASKMLSNYKAPYDATASDRLKKSGALLLGTANLDEFAMGSSTETSAFFKTKNPWDLSRVPGGSSGGSAAAVAAGFVPWALGSETGGSVRHPAALCGIVGLKPTYGLVSRYGLIAYGSSLDQIGVMARSVHDVAAVFSVIAGHDDKDSSSLMVQQKDYTASLDAPFPKKLKIGVIDNALSAQGMDPEISAAVETAIKQLESLGATVKHVSLPMLDYSAAAYFIISRAEAASNLARFDGVRYGLRDTKAPSLEQMYGNTRHDGFGAEVRKRILVGNYVLASGNVGQFYESADKVRALIRQEFAHIFKDVDLLVMPTHPVPAFPFGAYDNNKLQMDLQDYFTCPVNLAGIPAISIPCGFTTTKLPIGFQLIGPHLSEELLLQVAHAYEHKTMWHTMHPEGF